MMQCSTELNAANSGDDLSYTPSDGTASIVVADMTEGGRWRMMGRGLSSVHCALCDARGTFAVANVTRDAVL